MAWDIMDIRQCPHMADIVTDRIWRAWWKDKGHGIEVIEGPVRHNLASGDAFPFCLVAGRGGTFLGTVSLIANDVAERPELTPWVAALWVEPAARGQGLATTLLSAAQTQAAAIGLGRLYLLAARRMEAFYRERGWQVLESGTPAPQMTILVRDAAIR